MTKKIILSILLVFVFQISFSQNNNQDYSNKIEELAKTKVGLNDAVRIDLTGLTLYDFLTTLAEEHELNVSVDTELNQVVSGNFFDVTVKDVFLFLIQKYQLEVDLQNSILTFNKKKEEKVVEKPKPIKIIDVNFNESNGFLSLKLKNDSLPSVTQAITDASKKNVVLAPDVKTKKVSSYILNRPFDQVMEMFAKSNKLILTKDENDNYYLENDNSITKVPKVSGTSRKGKKALIKDYIKGDPGSFSIETNKQGFLNIKAYEADASDMITDAAEKLNINFFMYNTPEGVKTTLVANSITFDNLLDHLFKGEKYTYKRVEDLYLIGEHKTEGLRTTELVQLENRSIESVRASLPKSVTENLEVKEFIELNGFVVAGSKNHIQEFRDYIFQIDRVVPNVQIEVIIVQYQKSYEIQTGMQAGLDKNERTTSGVLFPTGDVNLNSTSVNGLIDAFNGLGIVNLGKVTDQFYLNLSFLENNSLIKTSSTPRLVTQNGHQASSTIGETSYYFEQSNQLLTGNINNNILQSGTWKSTEANLAINIKPFVSKDENVTLTIKVERSSFLGRAGENAPPGKATQQFESMIRVKNNEMILLGGLDELEKENSGTGTPFLARIPVIKWLFSGRKKRKEKAKLHIFIKPTVTY